MLPNGAEMLTEQLQAAGTEASARASFLRQAAAAWERATAAEMAREMESGSTIESHSPRSRPRISRANWSTFAGKVEPHSGGPHAASGLPVMVHLNGLASVRLK